MRRLARKAAVPRRMRTLRRRTALRTAPLTSDAAFRRLARGTEPIVVGPWLSEVGFEVLYWRPFLAWFADRYEVDPERLVIVSRGGAGCWYGDLAQTCLDVFDVMSPADFKRLNEDRTSHGGFQKQFTPTEMDATVVRKVSEAQGHDLDGAGLLHPWLMYRLFMPFFEGWRPVSGVRKRTLVRPLPQLDPPEQLADLDDYVAVKFYFSACFPETPENSAFVRTVMDALAAEHDVVLLSTGLDLDDHPDAEAVNNPRIHSIEPWLTARDNLELQTRVIAGARALVGTYGGFSYLGPFLGISSLSFFSEASFAPGHLDFMREALTDLRSARPGAGFLAQHVQDFDAFEKFGAILARREQ